MPPVRISASILAAPHGNPEEVRKAVEAAELIGADLLHIDVMDGRFVKEETLWNDPSHIRAIRTKLLLDVHIMIADPDERFLEFVHAGAKRLAYHIEAAKHPEAILRELQKWGVEAGLAINPDTPVEELLPYLHLIDYVLVMSVNPGKAGQAFLPSALKMVRYLREHHPALDIAIDGGINPQTAHQAAKTGATTIIAGAAIYRSPDPAAALRGLREAAQRP